MTTNDDDRPPISLAAERKLRERDFAAERTDLLQELKDIGVEEEELVQHVMFVEWAVFKAASMFEYHGIDQDAQAIVELVRSWRGQNEARQHRQSVAPTARALLPATPRRQEKRDCVGA